ncbi:MAG TPA: hypothetical protein PKY59_20310 [Pyrinomonadaceae bacterium]|nr:hypothetical protein [Pyrinomonadaceae bacterium]
MENKPLIYGGISLLLIASAIVFGYFMLASRTYFNESLLSIGLMFLGALICSILGVFLTIKMLFAGNEHKVLIILGGGLDLILTLLLLFFLGIILYFLIYIDPKNFRL